MRRHVIVLAVAAAALPTSNAVQTLGSERRTSAVKRPRPQSTEERAVDLTAFSQAALELAQQHQQQQQEQQLRKGEHKQPVEAYASVLVRRSASASAKHHAAPARRAATLHTVKVLSYFALWFTLGTWYNIVNKRVLNRLPLPWTVASAQLGIGGVWVAVQWLLRLRAAPSLGPYDLASVLPVAVFHGGGQLATVLSLGAGAVSFTHIVKAMEPFFSAVVSAVCFRQVFRPQVYAALIPVVAGVSVACYSELTFSWFSFAAAMISNLFFALRANFSKAIMARKPRAAPAAATAASATTAGTAAAAEPRSMSPANLYAVVTMTAFALTAPIALLAEGSKWGPAWAAARAGGAPAQALAMSVLLSGLTHYLNNEVMYLALNNVHPITLAVGNTMKRVFIIAASLIVFRNPISQLGAIGSAIGIGGVLLYSLARNYYG